MKTKKQRGRKPLNKEPHTLRINPDTWIKAEKLAYRKGLSISMLIESILKEKLDALSL